MAEAKVEVAHMCSLQMTDMQVQRAPNKSQCSFSSQNYHWYGNLDNEGPAKPGALFSLSPVFLMLIQPIITWVFLPILEYPGNHDAHYNEKINKECPHFVHLELSSSLQKVEYLQI